jgi:hypothetical protein
MSPKTVSVLSICVWALVVNGCGLSPTQQRDIARWQAEAVELGHPEVKYQEDVDSTKAVWLGFLPFGVAGFYVHRPGLAVSGFFWPLSITWVPAVAGPSAIQYNYAQLRQTMISLRNEERARSASNPPSAETAIQQAGSTAAALDRLKALRESGRISETEYVELRRKVLENVGKQ